MCVFEERFMASRFVFVSIPSSVLSRTMFVAPTETVPASGKTKDGDVTVWYLQLDGTATQPAFVPGNFYPRGHYL